MKAFNDVELITITKNLVAEERMKTLEVIAHIQEIYDRRLHLKQGYASLHEFLVQELKYSDGAAHRRISAMRLVRDVPEAGALVASGELSLTTAASVQNFFRAEAKVSKAQAPSSISVPCPTINPTPAAYTQAQKLEILCSVAGASRHDCEKKLAALSPAYAARPKPLVIEQDDELKSMLEEYRQLSMASDGSPQVLLRSALRMALGQLKAKKAARVSLDKPKAEEPKTRPAKSAFSQKLETPSATSASPEKLETLLTTPASLEKLKTLLTTSASLEKFKAHSTSSASPEKPPASPSRYVPSQDRRLVWARDQGRCTYKDPKSHRRCTATHRLELDHVVPFSHDGATEAANLRLLCRAHNQMRVADNQTRGTAAMNISGGRLPIDGARAL